MFACQKQNNKEQYEKSKLQYICKLTNNILENYRMLESSSFFRLLFSFMLRIFWNNKTKLEKIILCLCTLYVHPDSKSTKFQ